VSLQPERVIVRITAATEFTAHDLGVEAILQIVTPGEPRVFIMADSREALKAALDVDRHVADGLTRLFGPVESLPVSSVDDGLPDWRWAGAS